jgi:putative DNA primase/helicase
LWPAKARDAALALTGNADEGEQAPAILLLSDIRTLFHERGVDRLPSADIVEALVSCEDRPWPEWRRGKPLTARQLARLLGRFRVRPRAIRTADGTPRGYLRDQFKDAWARYTRSEPQHPQQPKNYGENSRFSTCNTQGLVADAKSGESPVKTGVVADVAPGDRGIGASQ